MMIDPNGTPMHPRQYVFAGPEIPFRCPQQEMRLLRRSASQVAAFPPSSR